MAKQLKSTPKSPQNALKPLHEHTDQVYLVEAVAERQAATRCLTEPFNIDEHKPLFTQKWGFTDLNLVACGAFGQIYKASKPVKGLTAGMKSLLPGSTQPKEKNYALKILASKYCTPKHRSIWHRREQREIAILKKLRGHGHIVCLQDSHFFGFDNAQTKLAPYLALKMEFLPYDLATVSAVQPLSWLELAPVVDQIGGALDWMHSRAIVHHDLKLANIMCTNLSSLETGRAWAQAIFKIVDFGLARCYKTTKGLPLHRETVWRAGTRRYKSPEKEDLTHSYDPFTADCYAFATTMVACLVGESVFIRLFDAYRVMLHVFENIRAMEGHGLQGREEQIAHNLYVGLRGLLNSTAYRISLKEALKICKR